jgi:hypothetical protein
MRCFTVDEKSSIGIPVHKRENELVVDLGDTYVPLHISLAVAIREARRDIVQELSQYDHLKQFSEEVAAETPRVVYADWAQDDYARPEQVFLKEESEKSKDALVYVTTCGGLGEVHYRSSIASEEEKDGRVVLNYDNPFPPKGVTILAEGYDGGGTRHLLLHMKQGASFRMTRNAGQGIPPVLVVVWTGGVNRKEGDEVITPLLVLTPKRHHRL